jgi:hypothetical protein
VLLSSASLADSFAVFLGGLQAMVAFACPVFLESRFLFELIAELLRRHEALRVAFDPDLFAKLFDAVFEVIGRLAGLMDALSTTETWPLFVEEILVPLLFTAHDAFGQKLAAYGLLDAAANFFQAFLALFPFFPLNIDRAAIVGSVMGVVVWSAILGPEVFQQDAVSFYNIAFEQSQFDQTPRDTAARFVKEMFEAAPSAVVGALVLAEGDEVEVQEAKIRLLGELPSKKCPGELQEYIQSLLSSCELHSLQPSLLYALLFLLLRSLKLLPGEAPPQALVCELLQSDQQILYIFGCDLVLAFVAYSIDFDAPIIAHLTASPFFSRTLHAFRLIPALAKQSPVLAAAFANEYIAEMCAVVTEAIGGGAGPSAGIDAVVQNIRALVDVCPTAIDYPPLLEFIAVCIPCPFIFSLIQVIFRAVVHLPASIPAGAALLKAILEHHAGSFHVMLFDDRVSHHLLALANSRPDIFVACLAQDLSPILERLVNAVYLTPTHQFVASMLFARCFQIGAIAGAEMAQFAQLVLDRFLADGGCSPAAFEVLATVLFVDPDFDFDAPDFHVRWRQSVRDFAYVTPYARAVQCAGMQAYLGRHPDNESEALLGELMLNRIQGKSEVHELKYIFGQSLMNTVNLGTHSKSIFDTAITP